MFFIALALQQVGAHHGGRGQGNDHGHENGRRKSDRKFPEETANDSAHHQKRNENGDQRNADGEDGKSDFFRTFQSRAKGAQAVFQVPRDILHDHGGLLDDKSRCNGHGHQRKVVDSISEQIHHRESPDQRDRHGNGGNERGPAVAQENKYHQNDQADGNEQSPFYVTHRGTDGGGAIQNDRGVDAERNGRLDRRKLRSYSVDRVNNVRGGLAENDDRNRALAIQIAGCTDVRHRVCHLSDVGQADRRALAISNDQGLVVRGVRDLIVGQDVRGHIAVGNLAFGQVGVLQTQH